jgi:hypothetical protein
MTMLLLLAALPAFAQDITVVGSLVREDPLAPGGHAEGVIVVRNDGDSPRDVTVYQRDYQFHSDGTNEFGPVGSLERSNGAWVHFTPNQLSVPAHATGSVYYTVDAPSSSPLQGTFWSLLMVEGTDTTNDAPVRGRPSVSIKTVVRYGVEIVTQLGGQDPGALTFVSGGVTRGDGRATLSLDIANTGERLLSPRVWVEAFDQNGERAGRFEAKGQPSLLPGCSARYAMDLADLPPGTYTGLAVADAGADQVFGADYNLDLRP